MDKLHKNAIITGCIDYYCLACDSYIRSEKDANNHIDKPVHKKNLDAAPYLQKYKDDRIRRVKTGYFCEFCNQLICTTAKTNLHISEPKHTGNKGIQLLQRVGNAVISFNQIFISERAWHGLIEDTCALCSTEFYSEHIHKTEQKHVLNLIQKNVEFSADGSIYRKVDDSSFQCLTCNMIFALDTLLAHLKHEDHKKTIENCRQFNPDKLSKPSAPTSEPKKESKPYLFNVNENNSDEKKISQMIKETVTNCISKKESKEVSTVEPTEINVNECKKTKVQDISSLNNESTEDYVKTRNNTKMQSKTDSIKPVASENKGTIKKVENHVVTLKNNNENKVLKKQCINDTKVSPQTEIGANKDVKQSNTPPEPIRKKLKSSNKRETNVNQNESNVPKKKQLDKPCDKAKILDNVTEFQKNGVNIDFETETAFCKKCFENVDMNFDAIDNHIGEHKNRPFTNSTPNLASVDVNFSETVLTNDKINPKANTKLDENQNITKHESPEKNAHFKTDNKPNVKTEVTATDNADDDLSTKTLVRYVPIATEEQIQNEIEKSKQQKTTIPEKHEMPNSADHNDPISFAKANNITFNKGNSNAFCRMCGARIPSSLHSMKEHVAGAAHRSKLEKVAATKRYIPKKPMKRFLKSITDNITSEDVIINDKFCLTKISFLMITKIENRHRCQACEVNLLEYDISDHVEEYSHELAQDETPIVSNLDTEFIREVRPGLFHCGFCNLIAGCWDDVDNHLKCEEHRTNKADAQRRLQEHMPYIIESRREEARRFMSIGLMLGHIGRIF